MISAQKNRQTFIVGDVHGCYEEFLELLKKLNYHKSIHRLILVGDIIGRGPYSLKMLNWVKREQIEVCRGNHENYFIKSAPTNQLMDPILAKLKKQMGTDLQKWVHWMKTWPFYIEEPDFIVVHAGLAPHTPLKETHPDILMHIRTWDGKGENLSNPNNPAWYDLYTEKKLVVYGHWSAQGLNIRSHTIGLDSSCVYGKCLSGLLLPQRTILQVPSQKRYYP